MMTLPISQADFLRNQELSERVLCEIQASATKAISFARFMELALYTPGLGYYAAATTKFGKSGDFVTAPEISPLFAECVAVQCQQILSQLTYADILEIGAGSGIFAKDILLALERLGSLPAHYYIVEISAALKLQQQEFLQTHCPHLMSRVQWLDALPGTFNGVIFANEVLDALPVHCFQLNAANLQERSVSWGQDHFEWRDTPAPSFLVEEVQRRLADIDLPPHYASEINLHASAWMQSLAKTLNQGVILLFDYGYGRKEYYHPQRTQGTLTCFHRHSRTDNPLINLGLQDITAHVDFTGIIESGVQFDLSLAGFTTQSAFLLSCGLLNLASPPGLDAVTQYQQSQAIKKLTLPGQMGEVIKVMALSKNFDTELLGFTLQDRRRDL